MIAVTDSGPLISLAKLNHLRLLPILYDTVILPQAVYDEAVTEGLRRGYVDANVTDAFLRRMKWLPIAPTRIPPDFAGSSRLGRGEREAITLAGEHQALLLIDEDYARSIAASMGLLTTGTLGILTEAYLRSLISADVLDDLLATIERRDDIWIHPDLCRHVRREVLER
ncbi:MAG: DUF3368 domain-containing protein [Chloroflexi bacterium HGW-Chloroflexi-1]|nr:MAG: DUF3368 domain-containing protein [Chloroflexi bacterium HGW-Chloroflexi-1]